MEYIWATGGKFALKKFGFNNFMMRNDEKC